MQNTKTVVLVNRKSLVLASRSLQRPWSEGHLCTLAVHKVVILQITNCQICIVLYTETRPTSYQDIRVRSVHFTQYSYIGSDTFTISKYCWKRVPFILFECVYINQPNYYISVCSEVIVVHLYLRMSWFDLLGVCHNSNAFCHENNLLHMNGLRWSFCYHPAVDQEA